MSSGNRTSSNTNRLGINRRGVIKSGIATALAGFGGVGSATAIEQTQESDGTEYFVGKDGDDTNDGLSRESPFRTIQRGVDELEPGDTLTIGPGEYHETVEREGLGAGDADTTIRADVPGTVVLRGDVPAPEFEKVDEYRHVYAAEFSQEVQAVNEVDSIEVLETVPNIPELDFDAGNFYYDGDAERLYISSSDMRSADEHDYTVSVLGNRAGLFLHHPTRVVIDGLVTTGFHSDTPFPRLPGGDGDSDRSPWGIFLPGADSCVVRNTTAYLNTGGIAIRSDGDRDQGGQNRVENCVAYGNRPRNGIRIYRPDGDVVRDSVAFRNGDIGIMFYVGYGGEQGRLEDNLSWGNEGWDYLLKTGSEKHVAERCVGPGEWKHETVDDFVRHSLLGGIRDAGRDNFQDNIVLSEEANLDLDAEFADPLNHDYRLQPGSRFRGQAEDGGDLGPYPYEETIYYVSTDGDDSNDGLSPATAWRSPARAADELDPGDTLYLEAGTYADGPQVAADSQGGAEPIYVRGRGAGQVVIQDTVAIDQGSNIEFERMNFAETVAVDQSQDVRFHNCRFLGSGGLQVDDVDGLRLTQSEFTGFDTAAVVLRNSADAYLAGNLFDNADGAAVDTDAADAIHYSDYNSYRDEATAWRIGGTTTALSDLDAETERYATVATPEFSVNGGTVELANPLTFDTGGPNGNSLGVNLRQAQRDDDVRELLIDGPVVHSTTATTANIEWWSSERAVFRVHWGETPAMEHSETLTPEICYGPANQLETFNTFSLDGLEPETEYHVEVEFVEFDDGDQNAEVDASEDLALTVTTAADDPEPRTLYVSPDGDDGQSGLSGSDAWETLHHAANQARPGDTVVIGEGTYREKVRIRATGTEDAPITFKAASDERVVLDGAEESLENAVSVFNHKDSLRFDGLYSHKYSRGDDGLGAFTLLRSDDIQITRCFHDGRDVEGYSPVMVAASVVDGLLVKNCTTVAPWGGMKMSSSTNVRIENNVILLPFIRAMGVEGSPREEVRVRNNIFTDNLPNKNGQPLIHSYYFGQEGEYWEFPAVENNCFFLRQPEEERDENVLGTGGWFEPHLSIEEYNEEWGVDNFEADPKFLMDRDEEDGNTRAWFNTGYAWRVTGFRDLLASNSELNRRDVGLNRGDLSDKIDHDE